MEVMRGSLWRTWDLHIHTPASYQWSGKQFRAMDSEEELSCIERIVQKLNSAQPAAFAVQDYWTFDGYIRIMRAVTNERVELKKPLFPGMEVRLVAPTNYRLNFHFLLSNDLSEQTLNDFRAHLRVAVVDKPLSDESLIAYARTLQPDEYDKHGFTETDLQDDQKCLELGSMTAEVTQESVKQAFETLPKNSGLKICPYDTSDGLSGIDWVNQTATAKVLMRLSDFFESRKQSNIDLLLGRRTSENNNFFESFMAAMGGRPKPVVSGSDAHRIEDYGAFPGDKRTWLKADTTFRGLLQVQQEPQLRSFVGYEPNEIRLCESETSRYIDSVNIVKKEGSNLADTWFDQNILLNPGLVSIVGNKGSGKSALADSIGLLGNSPQLPHASFLRAERFKGGKHKLASHFVGQLTWKSNDVNERLLDDDYDEKKVCQVKFLPQNYLEEICAGVDAHSDRQFQHELGKVIFDYVEDHQKEGFDTLEALVDYRTSELSGHIRSVKYEIEEIADELSAVVSELESESLSKAKVRLATRRQDLRDHLAKKPEFVKKPHVSDPLVLETQKKLDRVKARIKLNRKHLRVCESIRARLTKRNTNLEKAELQVENFKESFAKLVLNLEPLLTAEEFDAEAVMKLEVSPDLISTARNGVLDYLERVRTKIGQLDTTHDELKNEKRKFTEKLVVESQSYERFRSEFADWNAKAREIIGEKQANSDTDSIRGISRSVKELEGAPARYEALNAELSQKSEEIHKLKLKINEIFYQYHQPIHEHILADDLLASELQIGLESKLIEQAFREDFFEIVSHAKTGSFYGVEQGNSRLTEILEKVFWDDWNAVDTFQRELIQQLNIDHRVEERPPVSILDQLKGRKTLNELLVHIFSLEFLKPKFDLKLSSRSIEDLSPGERGAVLLVFYLSLSKDNRPIVIDQPEENLDNETIFRLLVPTLRSAKKSRQIIIVTHNPNLAVVADSDQVIRARYETHPNKRFKYEGGSVESERANLSLLNVLEGSRPAFDNRNHKYFS